eukprot:TRINITY_DN3286_c0_g1_i3.p2 TRINITY_DN3286_c0_g1~~TRINITY_DN3286_c0_g1_i3.p2  ORF type:complete len:225 (-),score=59.32 TRINITY_DN3286_c0_g1_i3:205-879(-)
MPVVTRYLFASLVVVTLAGNFGLIAPQTLMLIPEYIFGRFEIWRIVTNLMFMGKIGFSFLMQLMFLHNHSPATEDFLDRKEGQGAYLFFVVFAAVLLNLAGGLMQVPFMATSLIMSIIYFWSRCFSEQEVTFMFGIKFQGSYLPWVLVAFTVVMGGSPVMDLLGIAAGHIYYFLTHVLPSQPGGMRLLWTPELFKNIFHQGPRNPHTTWTGAHAWGGGGRRLGD